MQTLDEIFGVVDGERVEKRIITLVGVSQPLDLGAQVVLGLSPGVVENALLTCLLASLAGVLAVTHSGCYIEHGEDSDEKVAGTEMGNVSPENLLGRAPGIYERSSLLFFSCSAGRPCEPDAVEACLASRGSLALEQTAEAFDDAALH